MKHAVGVLMTVVCVAGCGDDGHHERALLEETRAMRGELRESMTRQIELLEQWRMNEDTRNATQLEELRQQMVPREELGPLHERLEDLTRELARMREETVPREAFEDVARRLDEMTGALERTREELGQLQERVALQNVQAPDVLPGSNTDALGSASQ